MQEVWDDMAQWRRFFPVFQDLAGIAKTVRTKMQVEKNDVEATWDPQRIQKNMPKFLK